MSYGQASEGEIVGVVRAALVGRSNMIYGKSDVLPLLCGMAVFAQVVCAFANLELDFRSYLAAQGRSPGLRSAST